MLTSADNGAVMVPNGSSLTDSSDESSSESGPNKVSCGRLLCIRSEARELDCSILTVGGRLSCCNRSLLLHNISFST